MGLREQHLCYLDTVTYEQKVAHDKALPLCVCMCESYVTNGVRNRAMLDAPGPGVSMHT